MVSRSSAPTSARSTVTRSAIAANVVDETHKLSDTPAVAPDGKALTGTRRPGRGPDRAVRGPLRPAHRQHGWWVGPAPHLPTRSPPW